jgi:hypothetical protein
MSGSVQVTIKGDASAYPKGCSVDETATSQTGTLAGDASASSKEGSGALCVDIKDITKTSIAVDYKEQDKVKVSVTSEAPMESHRLKSMAQTSIIRLSKSKDACTTSRSMHGNC